jgi:NAD-dependent SIR2 family protein deacetylase
VLGDKQPNRAHEALVELDRQGLLDAVVTQNIDMLHRKAGTKDLTSTSPTDAQPTHQRTGAHSPSAGGVAV